MHDLAECKGTLYEAVNVQLGESFVGKVKQVLSKLE